MTVENEILDLLESLDAKQSQTDIERGICIGLEIAISLMNVGR